MTTATKEKPKTNGRFNLSSVTKGGKASPPRTLLYGVDGIGKSTFAAEAPAAIFVPTEDGATRIQVPQFPLCESWADLFSALRSLCIEEHEYKTVVLDSADWAQALAQQHVIDEEYDGDVEKFDAYGRGYKSLMREWIKLLQALDYAHKRKGMEVILIAHAVVRPFRNPTGDDYDRYESNLLSSQNTSLWAKTKEWCDLVLFATYDVVVNTPEKAPPDRPKKGKGVMKRGDDSRVCHAAPAAAWDAKVRAGWSLPEKFPLSQAEFRKHLNGKDA